MTVSGSPIPIIQSISEIASGYEAWFCDIWGVIHNGVRPFRRASDACEKFRESGGVVVLLTNSPRPSPLVDAQLIEIGVSPNAYDGIVSSGDVARALVASRPGRPIFHLGPERDHGIFEGLDIGLTSADEAEIVLCSGLYDDETQTPDDYTKLLGELKERSLALICANPDIVVERGEKIVYCAGALAQRYAEMGGEVIYTGKPFKPIYDKGFETLASVLGRDVDRSKVLAIGDGLKTDMQGAFGASLDAAYVASAIHVDGHHEEASLTSSAVEALFRDMRQMPIAAMPRLDW